MLNQPGHTVSPWLVWSETNVLNRWAFTLPYMEGALGGGVEETYPSCLSSGLEETHSLG